jgi:4-amino-4-deoxy-L-arabinose transferase-like glycosyltransferase
VNTSFLTEIEKHPRAAFAAFAALHAAVWTALPTVFYRNLPLDLIEAMTYGREWQLGYDKLPPMPWWIVEALRIAVGHDVAYYAFSQLTVIAAFGVVWAMALPLVGPLGALVAILIIDGLHYFNFTAAKFNHDVVQLPFWALAGYAYWSALRGGKLGWWLALGASIGLAFWAKYFVVILAIPLALFLLLDPQARPALKTSGPWLAAAMALLVTAPHLVWLVQNDFLPFAYANARAAPARGVIGHIWHPFLYALSQIFYMLPALLIASPLYAQNPPRPLREMVDGFDNRIVTLLTFGPCATLLALSAITGRDLIPMWGYPLWLLLGLWVVILARQRVVHFPRIVILWGIVFVCFAIAFAADYIVKPYFNHAFRASNYPGYDLAQEISRRYRAKTGRPLAYVIGTIWDGGNIAHYAPERPRVLIDGDPKRAPWIDLDDLRAKGAVVIWTGQDPQTTLPPGFQAYADKVQIQENLKIRFLGNDRGRIEVFGWAILPPQP